MSVVKQEKINLPALALTVPAHCSSLRGLEDHHALPFWKKTMGNSYSYQESLVEQEWGPSWADNDPPIPPTPRPRPLCEPPRHVPAKDQDQKEPTIWIWWTLICLPGNEQCVTQPWTILASTARNHGIDYPDPVLWLLLVFDVNFSLGFSLEQWPATMGTFQSLLCRPNGKTIQGSRFISRGAKKVFPLALMLKIKLAPTTHNSKPVEATARESWIIQLQLSLTWIYAKWDFRLNFSEKCPELPPHTSCASGPVYIPKAFPVIIFHIAHVTFTRSNFPKVSFRDTNLLHHF